MADKSGGELKNDELVIGTACRESAQIPDKRLLRGCVFRGRLDSSFKHDVTESDDRTGVDEL